jgi:hypothetical protein
MNAIKIDKSWAKNQFKLGNKKLNITNEISTEILTNRVEQVENRVLGTESKVEELDQSRQWKILIRHEWNM